MQDDNRGGCNSGSVTKDQEEDVDAMKVVDADHLVDYLAETIADAEIAEFYSS